MPGPTIRLTFAGDSTDLERAMGRVGDAAGDMEKSFSLKSAGLAVAGGVAAAGLSEAFMNSLDVEQGQAKLSAQVGAYGKDAEALGKAAGAVYADGWGESMEDVNEATKSALQNLPGLTANSPELEGYTKGLLDLATVMGEDVGGAAQALGTMIKTGMVPDVQSGMDILTVLSQNGLGELVDTFTEYSTQFRKVGIDASTAGGLIKQAMDAGAPSVDKAADALKEFSLRAIASTDPATIDGFAALGLSADDMAKRFGAGGETASKALDETMDRLRGMKDPVEQARVATELFGTQFEDVGSALFAMDPSSAVQALGEVTGAAGKTSEALHDTAANKIEEAKRGFQGFLDSVVGVQGPVGDVASVVVGFGGDAIATAGSIGMAVVALSQLEIGTKLAAAGQWLLNVAMNANPIALVVLAIAALVGAFIWLWNNVEGFRNFFIGAWDWIKKAAGAAGDWIVGKFQSVVGFFRGLISTVGGIFSSIGSGISNAFKSAFNWVARLWNNTIGSLSFRIPDWVPGIGGRGLSMPKLPTFHTGGLVPGAEGSEVLALLQAGERVIPADRAGNGGGGTTVRFAGDTDGAFAAAFMKMVRAGEIQIEAA